MGEISRSGGASVGSVEADVSALYARSHRSLLRMATLMVGSSALAEEVVQDAFSELAPRWYAIEQPHAYVRRSVVNGCAQVLRRRETEAKYAALDPGDHVVELPDRLVELRDALDRLSPRQRLVVVLRYFVDIPDREVAEVLGVRPSTVRSLARRALIALRKELT